MKSSLNKKQLKSVIKECVREVMFEEGVISSLVSEIAAGFAKANLLEVKQEQEPSLTERVLENKQEPKKERTAYKQNKKRITETLTKMYGGVDLFEGTTPAPAQASGPGSAGSLSNIDPNDSGVDISSIPGMNNWKHLVK
jgi:hypothetical protein